MKASTTISLNSRLLEAARRIARREKRTFSAQLEIWLEKELAEHPDVEKPRRKPSAPV